MGIIPANRLEEFSKAIGNAFSHDELDFVCIRATGEGLFKAYVGPGLPVIETVQKLFLRLADIGTERPVLAVIYVSRPQDVALQALIESVYPDVKTPANAIVNVGHVVQGLKAIRNYVSNPAVKAEIRKSKVPLQNVADHVTYIGVYKNLHECLHQLQYKPYFELRQAADQLGDDSHSRTLKQYRDQVRDTLTKARSQVEDLPDDPIARQTEITWIEDLEKSSNDYNAAIDARSVEATKNALFEIKSLLSLGPARLNQQIFSAAKTLPLDGLSVALGAIAGFLGTENEQITRAADSMRDLRPGIIARVAQHKSWQDADKFVAALDDAFERSGNDVLVTFQQFWPRAKAQFKIITAIESDATWVGEFQKYAVQLDDQIAHETDSEDLRLAFDDFRGSLRSRFFAIDANLKTECAALSRVSSPLLAILEAADHV